MRSPTSQMASDVKICRQVGWNWIDLYSCVFGNFLAYPAFFYHDCGKVVGAIPLNLYISELCDA